MLSGGHPLYTHTHTTHRERYWTSLILEILDIPLLQVGFWEPQGLAGALGTSLASPLAIIPRDPRQLLLGGGSASLTHPHFASSSLFHWLLCLASLKQETIKSDPLFSLGSGEKERRRPAMAHLWLPCVSGF